jgi:hypothetical protein
MSDGPPHLREGMARALADPDIPLVYNDKFREYSTFVVPVS